MIGIKGIQVKPLRRGLDSIVNESVIITQSSNGWAADCPMALAQNQKTLPQPSPFVKMQDDFEKSEARITGEPPFRRALSEAHIIKRLVCVLLIPHLIWVL